MLVARDLQRQGHHLHLILGTMTAQLGDPSGKDTTRPILNPEEVARNADGILSLCRQIFDEGFEVHSNHTFFEEMGLPGFLTQVASRFTTKQLLAREGFRRREEAGNPIGLHELILPLLQGWDSVQVNADIEIGGTDQLFNFQLSRQLQEKFGQEPEVCIMTPIINGTDGRKMSKSFDNCIWVDEDPRDIFGKVMSLSDETCEEWIQVFMEKEPVVEHPMDRKKSLAWAIVELLHNSDIAGMSAQFFFDTIQKKQDVSEEEMQKLTSRKLTDAVREIRNCSFSQARRLIEGGGVRINGEKSFDLNAEIEIGNIIKVGKRDFGRVI